MKLREVVLVDDSDADLLYTGIIVEEAGVAHRVRPFGTAIEALDYLGGAHATEADLVLLDINMPEMDGFDFIAGARAHAAHKFTPILVLTTEAEGKMIDRAKALGATGWIVKPFQPEKVMSVVNRVVP